MQTHTAGALSVKLIVAILLQTAPLRAQSVDASPRQDIDIEYYTPSLTPAIYLVNFLFLYTANPDIAAYLPAYKAPIPQPVIDCLKLNPTGCPYAPLRHYFEEEAALGSGNRECFWSDLCQEDPKWDRLAPRKFRQTDQINEPLGRARADQLAHVLGLTDDMVLTPAEYQCLIGVPPRTPEQETFFRCIYNMTNSKGNALIPLSSYGLDVDEQGNVRSVCATDSPCIEINSLLTGYLAKTAVECGFLEKLLRMEAQTPFLQFITDGNQCQQSAGDACLVQTICTGKGQSK